MITAASINPGRLDRRISLRYPLATRDEMGASVEQWVESATVWGGWVQRNSREFIAALARNAETTGVLRIRHRTDVQATWRLVSGDDLFALSGDPIEEGRREYILLAVRALNQSPGDALSVEVLHGDDSSAIVLLHDGTPQLLNPAA